MRAGVSSLLLLLSLLAPAAGAGTLLVVNKSDDSLSLLDLPSGEVAATLPTGHGPHEVAVSPDGATAVVSIYGDGATRGDSLTVVDVAGARVLAEIPLGGRGRPHGLAWLPDGRRVLVTSETARALLVVDVARCRVDAALDTDQALSHMVALDPTRERAYVANIADGSVSVIDLALGERVKVVDTGNGSEGIAVRPGSGEVWVSNRDDDEIAVIDPRSLVVTRRVAVGAMPIRVAFDADGARAWVTNARDASVSLVDAAAGRERARIPVTGHYRLATGRRLGGLLGRRPLPIGLVTTPEGVYVASTHGGVVLRLDPQARRVAAELRAGAEPDGLAFSPLRAGAGGGAPLSVACDAG